MRTVADVHFFMFFQYCILLSYTGSDYLLGFTERKRFVGEGVKNVADTIEETQKALVDFEF